MSNKRTLADLMDNDFFIDFEDTKVKAERKSLTESLTRKRTLKESINESEVESCYKRVCASAAADKDSVIKSPDDIMIAVEVSKEHLKKALKLGAFSTFADKGPHTVPAQYVESVDLEFINNILLDEDHCLLSVHLYGEYEDESLLDYLGGDVCFVQFRHYPAFETEEEALEFFEKEIRPNGTKLAEELIDEAWAESGYKDYEGITDISGNTDYDEDDDLEDGGTDTKGKPIKPDFSNWETLIETADMLLTGLTHNSDNDNYDDGDGYWVTEYTVWCQRYLYYTDELNNEAKLKTLCDEYSKKLPGVTFYYNIDADEELCEIGYEASKQIEESKLKEGFYKYDYDLSEDKISEEDLYKALVTDGELISLNAGNTGEAVSFKDGGVYCDTTYEVTEYDGKFSVTEFYNSDDGDWKEGDYYFETDSFETLCAELQKIFPNALIECKMTEEVEEPDNAVVDCKVNKVIAHSEDEKPVDCLGKKKPLEKPLTEEPSKMTAAELKDKFGTDDVDIINAGREEQDRVELKEARSVAEIKAEIAKLQQELADAEVEEKKATELTLALAGKEQEIARLQSAINESDSKMKIAIMEEQRKAREIEAAKEAAFIKKVITGVVISLVPHLGEVGGDLILGQLAEHGRKGVGKGLSPLLKGGANGLEQDLLVLGDGDSYRGFSLGLFDLSALYNATHHLAPLGHILSKGDLTRSRSIPKEAVAVA